MSRIAHITTILTLLFAGPALAAGFADSLQVSLNPTTLGARDCDREYVLTIKATDRGNPATGLVDDLRSRTDKLEKTLAGHASSAAAHAKHMRDEVVPAMNSLREAADASEGFVPHGTWPLPT